jgi:hypothetical protein
MSIIKDFIVKAGIQIQSTATAVSTSSGALIVQGGAGLAGSVYAGGLGTFGAITSTQGTGSTTTTGGQTLRVNGGGAGIIGDTYINGRLGVSGSTVIQDGTNATSTTTGALQVAGGVGIGNNLWVGGQAWVLGAGVITTATLGIFGVSALYAGTDTAVSSNTGSVTVWNTSNLQSITNRGASTTNAISITNATASTNTGSGALIVSGGVGVGTNLNVGGYISSGASLYVATTASFNGTLDATTINTASVTMAGGLAVAKTIYSLNHVITSANASVATVASNALAMTNGGLGVAGTALIQGNTLISSTTTGASTNSGQALLVSGGVGVATSLYAGKVITTDQTLATFGGAGSLQVAGGAYIANNLVVMATTASTGTTSSNALYVKGGVGVEGSMYVGGPVTFSSPVTFNGTATYVLSTNTFYTDNMIELHTPPGGVSVPWTVDDGKDIGIRIHYYNGADQNAALVLDAISKELHWYSSGAEDLTGNFSTGTFGIFRTGSVVLTTGTTAISTSSGSLQITGGIGVNKNIWLAGVGQTASSSTVNAQGIVVSANGIGITGDSYFGNNVGIGGSLGITNGGSIGTYLSITGTGATGSTSSVSAQALRISAGGLGVTGASYIGGDASITGLVQLTNTTNATANGTAALVLSGGQYIVQDLRVGGTIYGTATSANTATNLAGGAQGSIPIQSANGTTSFIPLGNNGYILTAGATTATWANASGLTIGTANQALNVAVTGTNANAPFYPTLSSAVYPASVYTQLWSTSSFSINGNTGVVTFAAGVDSTTTATGTLVVAGGMGINKALTVGSTLTNYGPHLINNSTQATNTSSGALIVQGGVGVGAALYAGQLYDNANRVITSVTPNAGTAIGIRLVTTSGPSASFTVDNFGVTSLTGSTYIGVSASTGSVTIQNFGVQTLTAGTDTALTLTGANTGTVTVWNTSTLQSITQRGATTPYGISITSATNATSTGTGALQVAGGLGISRDLWLGGSFVRSGAISANAWGTSGIAVNSIASTYTDLTGTGAIATATIHSFGIPTITSGNTPTYADAANLYIAGAPVASGAGVTITNPWALYVNSGNVKIAATTVNNATNNGALVVSGGVGIAGNLTAGGYVQAGTAATGSPVIGFASNNLTVASYTSSALNAASTSSVQNLDVWSTSTYRSARYSIELVDTGYTPNRIHFTEIVLIHDGAANVYKSEYGVVTNLGELGTFDATVTGSGIQLTFQPTWPSLTPPSALVVKAVRTTIN